MALLAFCIAYVVQMHRESDAQETLEALARDEGSGVAHNDTEFQSRFPIIVSQLLNMDGKLSPKKQLEPFLKSPSLQWASINSLSTEGAEFILETKSQWPKKMVFDFRHDVSEELRQSLKSEFECAPDPED